MVGDVINDVNQFPTLSYNQVITYYYSSTQVKVIHSKKSKTLQEPLYDPMQRAPNPLIRTSIPCTDRVSFVSEGPTLTTVFPFLLKGERIQIPL